MESISLPCSRIYLNHTNPLSLRFHLSSSNSNPSILSFPYPYTTPLRRRSFPSRTTSAGGRGGISHRQGEAAYSAADLLRKPAVEARGEESWVDWEDRILEDTVPLVGFVRMILHSGKYENGERLSYEHENIILQRLLAHHPESAKKIGCGIDYIMVGHHPDFESSRCLFIVRKNGETVDFSYWKCIKEFIRKKYPLYADTFILQHFRRQRV